jgi:ABC-type uncharacterized transport system involved in gliding motility auxiliary subunit
MPVVRREDLPAAEGIDVRRRARLGAGSIAYTLLVVAALVLAVLLATRFRTTWDLTRQGSNSLSPKTVSALAALDAPVSVHGLLRDNDRRRDAYWDLLQRYRRASSQVTVEIFDPNARPAAFDALDLPALDRETIKNGASVVITPSRKTIFRGFAEEDVTNALLEAGSSARRVVGILRGYGERDIDATSDAGMSRVREALRQEYYDLADVRLDTAVPEEVTVLLAAGARAPLPAADAARLAAWLDAGGRLLVLLDPEQDAGFGAATASWGLRAVDLKVIDLRHNLRGRPEIPLASDFTRHPIVRGFGPAMPLALPLPVAVEAFESGDPAVYREALARTSSFSEGASAAGARAQGPFALAVAAHKATAGPEAASPETRIVLVGDVAFATNAFLGEAANRDFLLNCVGWLARSRGQVTIRPSPLTGQMLRLTSREGAIFQVLAAAPPFLVLLIGLIVHLQRRRL